MSADAILMTSPDGDWEALYIDGVAATQDHEIPRAEYETLLRRAGNPEVVEREAKGLDAETLRENGMFPGNLDELEEDYDFDDE